MKNKIMDLFIEDTICLTFKNIKIALGINEGTTELTEGLRKLIDDGLLSFNKVYRRYYKVPFNKYIEAVGNLFKEDTNMYYDDIYSSLEGISKEDLKLVLNDLELGGRLYHDDETDRYYNIPSNFFINKILNLFKTVNETLTLDDIRLYLNLKMNNALLLNVLKELEKDGKIYLDQENNIYSLFPSSYFINLLKSIFEIKSVTLSLQDIKSLLKTKDSKEEIKAALDALELAGKIYYDQDRNNYHTMPKNYMVATVKDVKDDKIAIILANKISYTISNNLNLRKQDKVLIARNKNAIKVIKVFSKDKQAEDKISEDILNLFYPHRLGYSFNDIKSVLGYVGDPQKLKLILEKLEIEGLIFFDEFKNRYFILSDEYIKAEVECMKKGSYFIRDNDNIKVLPDEIASEVLPNDIVVLKRIGKNFELVKIIKRYNAQIVCEVTNNELRAVGNSALKVYMDKKELEKLAFPNGTRILVNLLTTKTTKGYNVEFVQVLGHKNDFNAEFDAIAYNNGFVTQYTNEELEQLSSMPTEVSEEEKIGRVDLTPECIFTIDGSHTKDIDDAVSIKILDDGNYELTVSIAAVNHYIQFGSPLWKRAERNTTSLYMIESVAHMLHFQVSNGICSLNPGVERLAKSFRMVINPCGKIIDFKFMDTVIKSRKKMTYEEVNQILEDGIIPEGYEEFVPHLLKMQELSQILTNRHQSEGALDFGSKEVRFVFGENGTINDIEVVRTGLAEKLIENFMVATNEAMAEFMLNLGITFVYRNHEIPFDDKVLEATELIKNIGYQVEKIKNATDPHLIQKTIQSLRTKEEFIVLSTILLKSMKKAYFSSNNKGHYALALAAYSQTTSPIRRFLDLLIQYILDNLDKICDPNYDLDEFKNYVELMCERASKMERNADKAEYEADRLYMVNYCEAHPEQEYEAFVQEVTPEYIMVKTKQLIEGIVFFEDINAGNFEYNPNTKSIINKKTKEVIVIGSKLRILLKDFNKEFRVIYFKGFTPSEDIKRKRELPTYE